MALINLHQISLGFGGPLLLDLVNLHLERGERVCLIGRNGTGKSTLLKILNGEIQSDSGEISKSQGVKIAKLEQEVPRDTEGSILSIVLGGLDGLAQTMARYHEILKELETNSTESILEEFDRVQAKIDSLNGWDAEKRSEIILIAKF